MDINKILRDNPVSCKYGAPMGCANVFANNGQKLYLQRVYMTQGYAPDGTYWGHPNNLFCAFSPDFLTRVFIRAKNRRDAIRQLVDEYSYISFKKA